MNSDVCVCFAYVCDSLFVSLGVHVFMSMCAMCQPLHLCQCVSVYLHLCFSVLVHIQCFPLCVCVYVQSLPYMYIYTIRLLYMSVFT